MQLQDRGNGSGIRDLLWIVYGWTAVQISEFGYRYFGFRGAWVERGMHNFHAS